jgi:hypothetical protein
MNLRFLLFLCLIFLPLNIEANDCVRNGLKKIADETTYIRPLSHKEYLQAEAQFKKVDNKPSYMNHLRGEFVYNHTSNELKLNTGLHTHEALEFFKKMRPDLEKGVVIEELPNGVQVAFLPADAFEPLRLEKLGAKKKIVDGKALIFGKKSIFPKSWTEETIIEAIEKIRSNKASLVELKNDATIIVGDYQNVKVRIIIRDGEVKTAFPLAK